MELEELKAAWRALDARIEAGDALNATIFRELKLERARSALRPLWWFVAGELVIALGAVVLLGAFVANHWPSPRFVGPAIVLDVLMVLGVASAATQLRLLNSLDYAQPVVTSQHILAKLAMRRVRDVRWVWLLILPLWTPLAIVVMQGGFGLDLYRWFGAGWVAANVAFGIALTPLTVWLVRRLDSRISRDGILRALADDVAGRRLSDAMSRLDEVAAFESEARDAA